MILSLLPAGAVGAEALGDGASTRLLGAEEGLVARAVAKRRREFAVGRDCARRALAQLGVDAGPILAGPGREPLWPAGIVGSITHCPGYCAAVVARAERVLGVGIDAEGNAPLPAELRDLVCAPGELARDGEIPGVDAAKLIFSAKEAVYKAWYPLAGTYLGFLDATVALDAGRRELSVHLSAPDAVAADVRFAGRWAVGVEHVFTVVTATAG